MKLLKHLRFLAIITLIVLSLILVIRLAQDPPSLSLPQFTLAPTQGAVLWPWLRLGA